MSSFEEAYGEWVRLEEEAAVLGTQAARAAAEAARLVLTQHRAVRKVRQWAQVRGRPARRNSGEEEAR